MSERLPFAKKTLGQHFLRDARVIQNITEDHLANANLIIEVGPGPGALTQKLAGHQKPFMVFEKDERFQESLADLVGEDFVIMGDALEANFEEEIKRRGFESGVWLVSNLPYNVSVPLFTRFLRIESIQYMTLMFQREVALKIFDFTQSKNAMGSLMALAQTFLDCRLLCQAPPGCFVPPPKVDSTVLSFSRKEKTTIPLEHLEKFERFLRHLFQFKRKQVFKVLKAHYSEDKLNHSFKQLGLEPKQRAESFSLDQVQQLYLLLH